MNVSPGTHRFAFATWLFLRLLGIVHLCAFVSLWIQLPGLIGPHGILPAGDFLRATHEQLGSAAFLRLPSSQRRGCSSHRVGDDTAPRSRSSCSRS